MGWGRWAHFPAGLVFGLLFILFSGHPWRWFIAIDGAYTVYVFGLAIGSIIKDMDDLFGDPQIAKAALRLLIPHAAALAALTGGISLWFHLRTLLPSWMTHEGRKESLWDLLGWLALAVLGISQGIWMAEKMKRRLGKPQD